MKSHYKEPSIRSFLDNYNLLLFEQEEEEDMQLATTYFSHLMCLLELAFY